MSTTIKDTQKMIEEVLDAYPEKSKKDRAKHLAANDPTGQCSTCQVKSNIKSRPGVMTVRGCAYAGAKGVVWGPVKDMVHISHGPVGCGQYSWSQRRNYYIGKTGVDSFVTMQFTSDFQERDIVFGGDKKLGKVMDEIDGLVKVVSDARTDRLLGMHILGAQASHLIAEGAVAMEFAASAEDVARSVHAHPSLSEVIKEAAWAAQE